MTTFGLHRRPGLSASLSSSYCSKRQGCVRLSPLETLEAIHPTQTFSGRLRRRASLSSCQWRTTGPQLAFSVLGTIDVTGHCAIKDRPRRRALSWRAGREDRRRVFCKLHCGERQVDGEIFIFGCTCPLKSNKSIHGRAPFLISSLTLFPFSPFFLKSNRFS